jgi:hypothetical protein
MNKPVKPPNAVDVAELPLPPSPTEKRDMLIRATTDFDKVFPPESPAAAIDRSVAEGKISLATRDDDFEKVDFDWEDRECVVLPEQPQTAVYWNTQDELVIRQRRWPDDDPCIFVSRASVAEFIDRLTDICGVPSFGGPEPKPAPVRK